jgi:hypothetical protein
MTPSELKARIYARIEQLSEPQLKRLLDIIEREFFPDQPKKDQSKKQDRGS